MPLYFSQRAESDLEGIADYIAQDNAGRAVTYVQDMQARCIKLTQKPGAFLIVGEVDGVPVRKARFDKYQIYYIWIEEDDSIVILHIRHGSRQAPGNLLDDA